MKLADLQNNRRRKLYYTLFFFASRYQAQIWKNTSYQAGQGAHSDLSTSPFDPH